MIFDASYLISFNFIKGHSRYCNSWIWYCQTSWRRCVFRFQSVYEVYEQAGVPSGGSGAFSEMALASATSIAHKPKTLGHICMRKRSSTLFCKTLWP
jgi:hypothetical protein